MDDIKAPDSGNRPNPAAPEGSAPNAVHEDATPEMQPASPAPAPVAEDEKKGMKGWLVTVLVILALVIGAAGVYFWQTSSNTSDETEQLQSQIDKLNQDLIDAQKAAADNSLVAKDKEIADLTKENEDFATENETLKQQVKDLQDACDAIDGYDKNCQAE